MIAATRAKCLGVFICVCTWPITMLTLKIAVDDPLPFERSDCSGWEFYGVAFLFTICLGIYAMIAYSTFPIGRGYSIELSSLRATLGWSFVLAMLLFPFYFASILNAEFMATPRARVGTYFWALLFECSAGALRGWRPVFLVWLQHKRDREWQANLPESRLRQLLANPEAVGDFKQYCVKHYCSELSRRQSTHNSLRYPALLSGLRESSTAATSSRAGTVVRGGIASNNATWIARVLIRVHFWSVPQTVHARPTSAPSSPTPPQHLYHHQNHSSHPANDSTSTSNTASGPLASGDRLDQSWSRAGMSSFPPNDGEPQPRGAPLAQVRETASNSSSLPDAVRAAIAPFLDPCEPVPEDTHSEALPTDSLAVRLKYFLSRYIQPALRANMLEGVFARYDARNGPQLQHPPHSVGGPAHRGSHWTPAAAGHVIRERMRSSRHASSKSGATSSASGAGNNNGAAIVPKATVPMSPVGEEESGPSSVSMPPTLLSSPGTSLPP
ncbi:hypothetical protein BCR44DRAFT_1424201 [Catenaria anguillulae PL171]|uniref:Uncharacterized protein n=1 Tax=Catenaria anguillulae PL171 TaxID=765915 RepID=A0A1Y2I2C6_9FUNG|nr:hypothetical protein BCR44DRAFT_1424201 [Catenaria anguillulae PL171]